MKLTETTNGKTIKKIKYMENSPTCDKCTWMLMDGSDRFVNIPMKEIGGNFGDEIIHDPKTGELTGMRSRKLYQCTDCKEVKIY